LRLLLDTHVLLWVTQGRLQPQVREQIQDPENDVVVSAASIWEVEIKRALRRLQAPEGLASRVEQEGYRPLEITFQHAVEAGRLPRHHDDPFDRMLIAQARVEGLLLATADAAIRQYEVPVLDVTPS